MTRTEDQTEACSCQHRDHHGHSKRPVGHVGKAGPDPDADFAASSGWPRDSGTHSSQWERQWRVCRAAVKAAEGFSETLHKLTVEEDDLPEKMFNMDETSLFWKLMLRRTFVHKQTQ